VKLRTQVSLRGQGPGGKITARPATHPGNRTKCMPADSYVGASIDCIEMKGELRHGGEGIAACRGEAHPT
jgi:hypothetical protein